MGVFRINCSTYLLMVIHIWLVFTRKSPNFYSNIKSSLLKLLCTVAHLCEVTLLQPIRLDFFGIDFTSYPWSQFLFSTFRGQAGQQNKWKGVHIPWAWSTLQPAHSRDIVSHPISHLFANKVISMPRHTIPRCCAPLRNFSLLFCKIMFHVLTSFFLRYFCDVVIRDIYQTTTSDMKGEDYDKEVDSPNCAPPLPPRRPGNSG